MQELLAQWPKETVLEKDNIKIEIEDFTLKYYEDNELKTESDKKYYSDVKIVLDEKRLQYYVLDCEGSCIDVYSYPEFQYKSSHGKKQYWEDYLKEIKLRYFDGKDIDSTLTQLKLFFPKDMVLKEDGLYIWDERNFRIVNMNLDTFIQKSFTYIDNKTNKVFFDKNKIILLKGNEKEEIDYNENFIDLSKHYRDILKELYRKERFETYEEIIKEIEEKPNNLWPFYRKKIFASYSFTENKILKLNKINVLPENINNIVFNSFKDRFLFSKNDNLINFELCILESSGKIMNFTGIKEKFKRVLDIDCYNDIFYVCLYDEKTNRSEILKIENDLEIQKIEIPEELYNDFIFRILFFERKYYVLTASYNIYEINFFNNFFQKVYDNNRTFMTHFTVLKDNVLTISRNFTNKISRENFAINNDTIFLPNFFGTQKPIVYKNLVFIFSVLDSKLVVYDMIKKEILNYFIIDISVDSCFLYKKNLAFYSKKNGNLYLSKELYSFLGKE